jgi:hypothetical protein
MSNGSRSARKLPCRLIQKLRRFIGQYAQILDPYGVKPDLPRECQCVGRVYFARAPGSGMWVWFGDLPDATRDRLLARIDAGEFTHDLTWLFDEPASAP